MNALLLSALFVASPNLGEPISVRAAGIPVGELVQQLSAKAKTPLEAREVRGWPVFARIENRPVREVMDQLAKVTDAVWEKQPDGTMVLRRDRSRELAAIARDEELRLGSLTASIQEAIKARADAEDYSPAGVDKRRQVAEAERAKMMQGLPAGVSFDFVMSGTGSAMNLALKRALEGFKPQTLLRIPVGQRVVYSTQPNRYQKSFPFSTGRMVNDFVKAWNAETSVRTNDTKAGPSNSVLRNGVGKMLVAVTRSSTQDFDVQILAGDPAGNHIASQYERVTGAVTSPKLEVQSADSITVPPAVRRFAQGWEPAGGGGGAVRSVTFAVAVAGSRVMRFGGDDSGMPREFRDLYQNPEPWAAATGDIWLQAAEKMGKNLLLVPDDSQFRPALTPMNNERLTLKQVAALGTEIGLTQTVSDDWWTAQPTSQANADLSRVNRGAIQKLTGTLLKQGYAGLDEIAGYSDSMPLHAGRFNLDHLWLSRLSPSTDRKLTDEIYALRVYATLPPNMRRRNGSGPFSQLPSKAVGTIWNMVSREGGFRFGGLRSAVIMRRGLDEEQKFPSLAEFEFTESMGNREFTGSLTLEWENNEGVFAVNSKREGGNLMSLEELGSVRGTKIETDIPISAPSYDQFAPAWLSTLTLNIKLDTDRQSNGMLDDGGLQPNAKLLAYDQLPLATRTKVEEAEKRAPQIRTTSFGGKVPPP